MIRVHLTKDTHEALQALLRDPGLSPGERNRVEMILLSHDGWSPPRIARHLDYHAKTVRLALKGFRESGVSSLRHHPPGPAPDLERRSQIIAALDRLLSQERTWTAGQLAEALVGEGFRLSTRQTRKYLGKMEASWRRTKRSLAHKQDEKRVEHARGQLETLKKRPPMVA
jgi:transposase